MTGELVRQSYNENVGHLVPLTHEIWTGSMYTDPRVECEAPLYGRVADQSEDVRAAHGDAKLPVAFELVLTDGQRLKFRSDPASYGLVRGGGGAVATFKANLNPAEDPVEETRRWYLFQSDPDGSFFLLPHVVPDDRRAKQLV